MDAFPQVGCELPTDCWSGTMLGVYRNQLPHWVVDYGCYSLTFHCCDSLPASALRRLQEIVKSEQAVVAGSEEWLEQHRQRFKMMEYFLDQSFGECPFGQKSVRLAVADFLANYDEDGVRFRHWTIMTNHLHLLTEPVRLTSIADFKRAIKHFKMRSTQQVNRCSELSGKLWMSSGYDRWIRDAVEYSRWVRYLRANPVKAGLCHTPEEWGGLR